MIGFEGSRKPWETEILHNGGFCSFGARRCRAHLLPSLLLVCSLLIVCEEKSREIGTRRLAVFNILRAFGRERLILFKKARDFIDRSESLLLVAHLLGHILLHLLQKVPSRASVFGLLLGRRGLLPVHRRENADGLRFLHLRAIEELIGQNFLGDERFRLLGRAGRCGLFKPGQFVPHRVVQRLKLQYPCQIPSGERASPLRGVHLGQFPQRGHVAGVQTERPFKGNSSLLCSPLGPMAFCQNEVPVDVQRMCLGSSRAERFRLPKVSLLQICRGQSREYEGVLIFLKNPLESGQFVLIHSRSPLTRITDTDYTDSQVPVEIQDSCGFSNPKSEIRNPLRRKALHA